MISEFRADLHCHSCFSDGTNTPEELIQLAIDQGFSGLSITDHDTILAYETALEQAKAKNILLLNGVEFSASYRGEPVHILGYSYHIKSEAVARLCKKHMQRREERNRKILTKLRALNICIDIEELQQSGCRRSIGRPHIAHILLTRGIVGSIQEAFQRYLAEGKAAYDPGEPISVEETIETIHKGKGLAILAHPHLLKRTTTIRAMLHMPFDGLEGYYARLNLAQEKKWIELAKQRQWLITGGSDYHGQTKPMSIFGSSWVGKETFDQLYRHFLNANSFEKQKNG